MKLDPYKPSMLKKLRDRVDSWVMLDETTGFVPLPKERILFTSPLRTTLAIQTPNSYPGKETLAIHSSAGIAFLTNQRVGIPNFGWFISLLTSSRPTARLPARSANKTSPVLLHTHHEPPRCPRPRSFFWRQCLDRYSSASHRRRNSTTSRICRDKNDVQRGRSIRLSFNI